MTEPPLRILLLVEGFNVLGGIPEIVDNLAVGLVGLGQQVLIASTRDNRAEAGDRERSARTAGECVYLRIRKRKPGSWLRPDRIVTEPLRVLASPFVRLIRSWRPSLVNSHLYMWDRYPNVEMVARRMGIALIQSFHSFDMGQGRLGLRGLQSIGGARGFTALSEATREFIGRRLPAAAGARVISGGVDSEAARSAPAFARARPYIFSACRLDLTQKAVDTLIEAFAAVAPLHPVDLVIAGGGPDRARLERLAAELGLAQRVFFIGAQSRQQLRPLYKGAVLFALPSRREEAMGLVFLEAMAAGCSVIGSRLGGVPEIVPEGVAGLLVAEGDVPGWSAAMNRLLSCPGERQAMAISGQAWVQRFSWTAFSEQYLDFYRSCLRAG